MTSSSSPYPTMPSRLVLALDPQEVLELLGEGELELAVNAIADGLRAPLESLMWRRLEELGSDWTLNYPSLYLHLDNSEYPELLECFTADTRLFQHVFDGFPPELQQELSVLSEFIARVYGVDESLDADAFRNELGLILPGLWLFDEDLHAFVLTLMLLATINFEGTLLGMIKGSFLGEQGLQEPLQPWSEFWGGIVLGYDHLILDPGVHTGLEVLPRLPLHKIDFDGHVHSFGPPIGHWIPGEFSLRPKLEAGTEEGTDPTHLPFRPVRFTDHNCIIRFVYGRWCCLGDAEEFDAEVTDKTIESAGAESIRDGDVNAANLALPIESEDEDEDDYCEDEFDPSFRAKYGLPVLRNPQQWVDHGLQLWMPVITALFELDADLRVRMTPIARFDIEQGLERDAKFYELLALQPFVFELFNIQTGEPEFGFGPGDHLAYKRSDNWRAETLGVFVEGGPQDIAQWLHYDYGEAE